MLIRYAKSADGKPVKQAEVYTKEEHGLKLEDIDPDALFVTKKLRSAGYESYIVGGAVRDLLMGRKPKDFDIATDAHPRAIKKILPFSRIIGKRFRLVHVYFPGNKIFEVATFRSDVEGDNNVFGTLEEDAKRRDFSINALFYDPKDQYIVDLVGGMKDIRARRIRNVIPLEEIFDDDPVRMIRAAKYSTTIQFQIPGSLRSKIRQKSALLEGISPARLTEEFYKILHSGKAAGIFEAMAKLTILEHFVPLLGGPLKRPWFNHRAKALSEGLGLLDNAVNTGKEVDRSTALTYILAPVLESEGWRTRATSEDFEPLLAQIKQWFQPILPSNQELENALRSLYRVWAVRAPRKRPPRNRRRRPGNGNGTGTRTAKGDAPSLT